LIVAMRRGLLPSLLSILPMAAGVCVRLDQVCASPREYSCPEMFPSPCQDGFLRDDTTSADFCCSYMAPHEFAVPTYTPCDTRCSPCNSDECPAAEPYPQSECTRPRSTATICQYGCNLGGLAGGDNYTYSSFAHCDANGRWMLAMEGSGPPACPCPQGSRALLFGGPREVGPPTTAPECC
jgi:hypothetical protein